uniref:Phage tail protein n=1 Tax=Macrostomum lignano TaxID=282301 RepID=A0A1I8H7K9_9PLAT
MAGASRQTAALINWKNLPVND